MLVTLQMDGTSCGQLKEVGCKLTFGSDLKQSDVVVPGTDVEPKHCSLTVTPNGILLRDLNSQTGTWCDGKRIRKRNLTGDATLLIGAWTVELTFVEPYHEDEIAVAVENKEILNADDSRGDAADADRTPRRKIRRKRWARTLVRNVSENGLVGAVRGSGGKGDATQPLKVCAALLLLAIGAYLLFATVFPSTAAPVLQNIQIMGRLDIPESGPRAARIRLDAMGNTDTGPTFFDVSPDQSFAIPFIAEGNYFLTLVDHSGRDLRYRLSPDLKNSEHVFPEGDKILLAAYRSVLELVIPVENY